MYRGSQSSFFDDPAEGSAEETQNGKTQNVAEVFELAREYFRLLASVDDLAKPEPPVLARARTRRLEKARELGLVAKWASYKKARGHVSVHDPATGEWYDLPWKDAPSWAKWEAGKRSALYKATGDRGAFDLTAGQMRQLWEEHPPSEAEEGIVEEYELPDD